MSSRALDWESFSRKVDKHIVEYTIPQYGDKGDDQADGYTVEDFVKQIKKYATRSGKNSRPGQEELDLIKIAHYAQMAHTLIGEEDAH